MCVCVCVCVGVLVCLSVCKWNGHEGPCASNSNTGRACDEGGERDC